MPDVLHGSLYGEVLACLRACATPDVLHGSLAWARACAPAGPRTSTQSAWGRSRTCWGPLASQAQPQGALRLPGLLLPGPAPRGGLHTAAAPCASAGYFAASTLRAAWWRPTSPLLV